MNEDPGKNKEMEEMAEESQDEQFHDNPSENHAKGKSLKADKKKDKHQADKELQFRIEELNDKYLRIYSEFDNYRKRTLREKNDLLKTASADLITDLLPVLDDFERALKSFSPETSCDASLQGVKLIFEKFRSILERKGLKEIDATGKDFDTDFHEAVTSIPASTPELKGKVIDVIEKGYLLNEKVIRFAKVVTGS